MFTRPHHDILYAQPRYFDIAFDTLDLEIASGFLEHLSRHLGRGPIVSYLEVSCGPGYLMHRLAARGVRAYGVDASAEMVAYALEKARRLAALRSTGCDGWQESRPTSPGLASPPFAMALRASPTEITLPEAVDVAFCPRAALRYLLKDEEVIAHLVAVARNLGRGGLYVLELDHPGIYFREAGRVRQGWVVERGDVRVTVHWGGDDERVDPLTHASDVEAVLEVEDGGSTQILRDIAPLRAFTHPELRALVRLSGVFEWVTTFGDLNVLQPFDDSPEARAMVPVLRCAI
jgi:SAM-dependent methyltransferase